MNTAIPALNPAAAGRALLIPAAARDAIASWFAPVDTDPDATLIGIVAALEAAEARLGDINAIEERTGLDNPDVLPELDRMDLLLLRAASLTPTTAFWFAARRGSTRS